MLRSSQATAEWAAELLKSRGLDQRAEWRMLEYWFQVELYHGLVSGGAPGWGHYGQYEQPYYTHRPTRSESKTKIKWVDLLCASLSSDAPERLVWLELKDVGRNPDRLDANAWGLGKDLVALYEIDPVKTAAVWREPDENVRDAGRTEEWASRAKGLLDAEFGIGQVVIVDLKILDRYTPERFEARWRRSWETGMPGQEVVLGRSDTDRFAVYAVISNPKVRGCLR